jgi:branched-chain amino acid transport system substrate-binding protein
MSARTRSLALAVTALAAAGAALPVAASAQSLPAPAKIGAVFSLTGAGAPYGPSQQRGAQLAVDEVNAAGGVAGARSLTLDVRDDHSVPADAAALFTALIDDRADALVGPTLSGSAVVADKVAQERGIPVMGVSNTIDGLTDIGPYVFRDSLPESQVQPQTVKVAKQRFKLKRVAIVATTDTYSAAGRTVFRAALKKQRIAVTADRTFATGDAASLRAALKAVAKTKPDALVISALQNDAAAAMVRARTFTALKKVHFIGGNAFNAPGLFAQTKGAAKGAVSGAAWVAARDTPGNAAFVAAYQAKYGTAPDQFAAQAYAGVKLIADTMLKNSLVGVSTPSGLRDSLAAIRDKDTILGSFTFDAAREPRYAAAVVMIDGKGRQVAIG